MAYTNRVHGPPDEADEPLGGRKPGAGQTDGIALEEEARQCLFQRMERLKSLERQRPIDFRTAPIVAHTEPERIERKQQIAEQDRGVEIETLDRTECNLRGELWCAAEGVERMDGTQALVMGVVTPGLSHQPDRRHGGRLPGQHATKRTRHC